MRSPLIPAAALVTLVALAGAAHAEGAAAAYYHPDDVAAQSKAFASAAASMGPAFEQAQGELTRLSRGLEVLEAGVLLLGDRVPPDQAEAAQRIRRTVTGQFLQLQRHVDLLQDDYGQVFGAALDRALGEVSAGRTVAECGGGGVAAMMGRASCAGEDLNGKLAAAVDADPALKTDVAELNALAWPEVGVDGAAWAPVALTGTERWVSSEALVRAFAAGAVGRREAALEDALDPLVEQIEAGDAAAVEKGRKIRAQYEAGLAADGEVLWAAATAALEKAAKKGGPQAVGVCPNPEALGGCTGEDATRAVMAALEADRKFLKAVRGLE